LEKKHKQKRQDDGKNDFRDHVGGGKHRKQHKNREEHGVGIGWQQIFVAAQVRRILGDGFGRRDRHIG
jgi:hypothetical protein